jgi:hypothetical protein
MAESKSIWERIKDSTKEAKVAILNAGIKKTVATIAKLDEQIKSTSERWTKGYHRFIKAAEEISQIVQHGTKKEAELRTIILEWTTRTEEQTRDKHSIRNEKEQKKEELNKMKLELAKIEAELNAEKVANSEIVDQVFNLHSMVVDSLKARNDYLSEKVYNRLIDDNGNLRSQLTILHPNGLKKIVAMVNSITKIVPELAIEAKAEIDKFFGRFQKAEEMSVEMKALYEIVQQLLIEKTTFKVGSELYRFFDLNIDESVFPELKKAQSLLRRSLRSERTESYIKLYERKSLSDKWIALSIE